MVKAIAKIGRENHQKHLIKAMPIITSIYGIQCYIMLTFGKSQSNGDFALILGLSLIGFILSLFYYDNNHHVIFYPDYLKVNFSIIGVDREITYEEIEEVITAPEETQFAAVTLKLKDGEKLSFFFVDYPTLVKKIIDEQRYKAFGQQQAA